jgi:hypothetical protein
MKVVRSLTLQLKPLLGWHQSRLECLAHIIVNLIVSGSVNLVTIAEFMRGDAKIASHHKRLKRFFCGYDFCLDQIARIIVTWMAPDKDWVLTIDRTNWKLGKKTINIFMLAIVLKGVALPVIWMILPRDGNTNTTQRITLLSRFIRLFGTSKIAYLTADREFKGGDWLRWLRKNNIHWRIRITKDTLIPNKYENRKLKATRFFSLQVGESMHLNKVRTVWGVEVFVAAHRSAQEHIIIVSDVPSKSILNDYMLRWNVETLFQSYKERGFNLEDTRLVEAEKLSRLLAVMALALCWCYSTGTWRNEQEPIKVLKHKRLAFSLFRYGLSLLRSTLVNPIRKCRKLASLLRKFCESVSSKLSTSVIEQAVFIC